MAFLQEDFEYKDLYSENTYLSDVLKAYCDQKHTEKIETDLKKFSKRAKGEVLEMMWQAEGQPPTHKAFDHWGKRVDEIVMHPAWDQLHDVSASEGIVAIGYERDSGADSRLHQFLKLMLFHPSSAFYSCPLAMTDGAARVLETNMTDSRKEVFSHLIDRDPEEFWTAGQWMTEKTGGSDVSRSETYAELKDDRYYLYGTKWFTSAITAQIAMTLAQTEVDGKKRLSLFMVKIRNENGELNNIEVLRLKDKLGTKAMPTAELELQGVEGELIGDLGSGVKNIATVLNISRLYNSVCATGTIYRLHSLLLDYSQKREAFGKKLIDHPLHQQTLMKTQADTKACVHFIAQLGKSLGRSELGEADQEELAFLRVFTPVAKLWTAKKSVNTTSELVEGFGGAGYIEDTQIPRFLRDAQVFSIWEGTTNIMSLDTLRALSQGDNAKNCFTYLEKRLKVLKESAETIKIKKLFGEVQSWLIENKENLEVLQKGARTLSFALADGLAGLLLSEFAMHTKKSRDEQMLRVFVENINWPQWSESEDLKEQVKQTLLS